MKYMRVNLLSQGLHGCVLNMFSLFSDPVRFVRDQYGQNHLNQDQHMLQTHTEVKMSEEPTLMWLFWMWLSLMTSLSSSLPPPKQPTTECLCCSSRPPDTGLVTMVTASAASSWTRPRQNSGPRKRSETQDNGRELFALNWLSVTCRLRLISIVHCVFCWPATRPC